MRESRLVDLSVVDGLATVRLQRPDARNALSPELVADLRDAFAGIREDGNVRGVVLAGVPKGAFCSGIDLRALLALEPSRVAAYFEQVATLLWEVSSCPKPVLAAVEGPALGAGADLAVACDVRVAGRDASFAFPGLAFGLVLGTRRLARLVGPGRAKRLVFGGQRIGSEEAYAYGLVDVLADDCEARALDLARRAAERPEHALAMARGLAGPGGTLEEELLPVLESVRHPAFLDRLRAYTESRLRAGGS